MSRKYEFDHYVPGLIMVAGVAGIGAGSVLPWLTATGTQVGINLDIFSAQVQKTTSVDGLDSRARSVMIVILVAGGIALLAAIALMTSHRGRGLFLRFVSLCCGCAVGGLGVYFLTVPNQKKPGLEGVLTQFGAASVQPGTGSYLLVFGGLAVVLGCLIPGRRSALAASPEPSGAV